MTSKELLTKYSYLIQEEKNIKIDIEINQNKINTFRLDPGTAFYNSIYGEKEQLESKIKAIEEEKQNIVDNINSIKNDLYRDILYYRYIKLMAWEDVTEAINKEAEKPRSLNNVKQYSHNKALEELQNILDNK